MQPQIIEIRTYKQSKQKQNVNKKKNNSINLQFQCNLCGLLKNNSHEIELHQLSCFYGERKFKKFRGISKSGIDNQKFLSITNNTNCRLDLNGYRCRFCNFYDRGRKYVEKHQSICHFLENKNNQRLIASISDQKTLQLDLNQNLKIVSYQILYLKIEDNKKLYKYYKCYYCSYTDFRLVVIQKHQIKNCLRFTKTQPLQDSPQKQQKSLFSQSTKTKQQKETQSRDLRKRRTQIMICTHQELGIRKKLRSSQRKLMNRETEE